jgi:hypothetical protein
MEFDKIMTALRNAHAAGDTAAAQRLGQMAMAARQQLAPAPQAAPAQLDPMIPSGDTDTRSTLEFTGGREQPLIDTSMIGQTDGGRAMDLVRSGASGLARGATELVALPATIGDGLGALYERLGIIPEGSRELEPSIGTGIRNVASALTSGGTQYQPQTLPGEYAQTVGEFVGGGAGGRAGVLGGLLSEGAGQATEGTAAEPYARVAGGIIGSLGSGPRLTQARVGDLDSPAGQRAAMANALRSEGINVTRGQQTNNSLLRRMEGTLDAPNIQPEQVTSVVMRRLGSDANIATPSALANVQKNIVSEMDDAVRGADIVPLPRHAAAADDVATTYIANVETGLAVPRVREIVTEISAASGQSRPVDLSTLATWRRDIGRLTVSSNPETRRAAQSLRRLVDDMTDTALTSAGRTDDIAKLASARTRYRDFLAVRDAATRAGAEDGILSPMQLNNSFIKVMGRENVGVGRTTDAADFVRSAAGVLRSAPTVSSGGVRAIESLPTILGGAGGFAAGGIPGALAGLAAPIVGQSVMRTAPIQSLLINPRAAALNTLRTAPGLLSQ